MTREEAIAAINNDSPKRRLEGARALLRTASAADLTTLKAAISSERVGWVRNALQLVIARLTRNNQKQADAEDAGGDISDSKTLFVRLFIHEVDPIIGTLRYVLQREIAEHEKSKSWQELTRLKAKVDAFKAMDEASVIHGLLQHRIQSVLHQIITSEFQSTKRIRLDGDPNATTRTDARLLELIVTNAIRNALEADETDGEVLVTWSVTDIGYAISVLDRGPGPNSSLPLGFRPGVTTKEDGHGYGLAVAAVAAETLGGTISLTKAQYGGALFRFECMGARK